MEHKKEFKKIGFIFGLKKELKLVSSTNNNKFCVEFGAADGDFISNTKYLSELNYKSLLIEPSKKNFKKLIKNRPNDICLNYVVKSKNESEEQVIFYDAGLYS